MSRACHFCHLLNQYICNEADHCGACDLSALETSAPRKEADES